jgi:replicative DNA helicase
MNERIDKIHDISARRTQDIQEQDISYSPDVEHSLVGAIISDPSLVGSVAWVQPEWFSAKYQIFWKAIMDVSQSGQVCDIITVADMIESYHDPITDDPFSELGLISANAPVSTGIAEWACIIHRKFQQRSLLLAAQELSQYAFRADPEKVGTRALRRILAVLDSSQADTMIKSVSKGLEEFTDHLQQSIDNPHMLMKTGYGAIDNAIGGFRPGELTYIAARPSMGKSAIALGIARRMSARFKHTNQKGSVLYVTLEMSVLDHIERLIASISDPPIDTSFIRNGFRLPSGDIDVETYSDVLRYVGMEDDATNGHLYFSEWPDTNTDTLNLMVMQVPDCKVLIIDQLDLLEEPGKDEYTQLSAISKKLMKLADRHKIAVICLCQLNRKLEERTDRRPLLSDLRSTGRLEQDADMVLALHRPEYYYPPADDISPDSPLRFYPNYAEMIILKNRKGRRARSVPLFWKPESAQFDDWSDDIFNALVNISQYVQIREKNG